MKIQRGGLALRAMVQCAILMVAAWLTGCSAKTTSNDVTGQTTSALGLAGSSACGSNCGPWESCQYHYVQDGMIQLLVPACLPCGMAGQPECDFSGETVGCQPAYTPANGNYLSPSTCTMCNEAEDGGVCLNTLGQCGVMCGAWQYCEPTRTYVESTPVKEPIAEVVVRSPGPVKGPPTITIPASCQACGGAGQPVCDLTGENQGCNAADVTVSSLPGLVNIGGTCECAPGTIAVGNGSDLCTCPEGQVASGGQCVACGGPDQWACPTLGCSAPNAFHNTTTNTCMCETNYINVSGTCIPCGSLWEPTCATNQSSAGGCNSGLTNVGGLCVQGEISYNFQYQTNIGYSFNGTVIYNYPSEANGIGYTMTSNNEGLLKSLGMVVECVLTAPQPKSGLGNAVTIKWSNATNNVLSLGWTSNIVQSSGKTTTSGAGSLSSGGTTFTPGDWYAMLESSQLTCYTLSDMNPNGSTTSGDCGSCCSDDSAPAYCTFLGCNCSADNGVESDPAVVPGADDGDNDDGDDDGNDGDDGDDSVKVIRTTVAQDHQRQVNR